MTSAGLATTSPSGPHDPCAPPPHGRAQRYDGSLEGPHPWIWGLGLQDRPCPGCSRLSPSRRHQRCPPTHPPSGDDPLARCWSSQIPISKLMGLDESLWLPTPGASDRDPAHEADVFCSLVSQGGRGEQTLLILPTLGLPLTSRVRRASSIGMMLLPGAQACPPKQGRGAVSGTGTDRSRDASSLTAVVSSKCQPVGAVVLPSAEGGWRVRPPGGSHPPPRGQWHCPAPHSL